MLIDGNAIVLNPCFFANSRLFVGHKNPKGVNAQALRFLNFLISETITVEIDDISIALPHPANFALHKLIIYQRRQVVDKKLKDKEAAIRILRALIANGDIKLIKKAFDSIPKGWQRKIIKGLEKTKEVDILDILKS